MKLRTQAKENTSKKEKLEVIIERNDALLWGRTEVGDQLFTPYGETIDKLLINLKELITDHVEHEGSGDEFWTKIDVENLDIELKYDLQAFFMEHNYLKISAIAQQAGINPGLVRQYASGVKYPSLEQAKKIETAIHKIAKTLQEVAIHA
ncbi:MAG: hypothetical protein JWQ09_3985 [Segetibacter sp.]|nr:hypothetical protein [Segetibacter sp.]